MSFRYGLVFLGDLVLWVWYRIPEFGDFVLLGVVYGLVVAGL